MRWLRYALWPAGLAFGVAAEWVGRPELIALDAAAGFALVFLGLVAWSRRPGSRAGPIMSAAGFAWFLGTLWAPAVFLHRGPLAQLLISYPGGRLSSRLQRVGAGAAYVYAAVDRGRRERLRDDHLCAWPGRAVGATVCGRDWHRSGGRGWRPSPRPWRSGWSWWPVRIVRLAGVGGDRAMLAVV